ncbi:MAG TPA: DUF882 domain-containing protein [Thermodesulfovibrionales bacterium]|nr:DUF882 domain-containing protein [Thermodesulfovibrionales bacterium]
MLLSKPVFPKDLPIHKFPLGTLSLYNIHTDERLEVTYRKASGEYDQEALRALNWVMRCHYTGQVADMDVNVIEFLNMVDKQLGGNNDIHVISGFRSHEYNQLLVERGRHVARNSLHVQGKAIDISIPKVDLVLLKDTALNLRYGGVGYYPRDFVHLDSGRFRTW